MKTSLPTIKSSTLLYFVMLLVFLLFFTMIVSAQNMNQEWVGHYHNSAIDPSILENVI